MSTFGSELLGPSTPRRGQSRELTHGKWHLDLDRCQIFSGNAANDSFASGADPGWFSSIDDIAILAWPTCGPTYVRFYFANLASRSALLAGLFMKLVTRMARDLQVRGPRSGAHRRW